MFSRVLLVWRMVLCVCVAAVGAVTLGTAWGQRPDDGQEALERAAKANRELIRQLFTGDVPADPKNDKHVEAIDVAAKQVTYPFYWPGTYETERDRPNQVYVTFDGHERNLGSISKKKEATAALAQLYTRQVIKRATEVAQEGARQGKPAAAVNATRVLARLVDRDSPKDTDKEWAEEVAPRLADKNGDALAEAFVGLLKDTRQNDGARYWALRGLRDLLALPAQTPPLVSRAAEQQAVREALRVVERRTGFPREVPRDEKNGFRLLRREAIRVLAQARLPRLGEKEAPALVLARVVGNDKRFNPLPRLDERLEAAVGLARMRVDPKDKDYHPDYAAEQIARFVGSFVEKANSERNETDFPAYKRSRPWKVDAARLLEALAEMKATAKNAYVSQAVDKCTPLLQQVERGGEGANPGEVINWVDENTAPGKRLFGDVDDSTVAPARSEDDDTPPPAPEKAPDAKDKGKEKGKDKAKGKGKPKTPTKPGR